MKATVEPLNQDIERRAAQLLTTFFGANRESLRQFSQNHLCPKVEDYERVFQPNAVQSARLGYELIWSESPFPGPKPGQEQVLVYSALAEELGVESGRSQLFPGGYQRIAHNLLPHRIWLAWKYVKRGEHSGMAYDGLVWLDGRFAWFPKPWRVL
jgi:hypothetical protein